MSAPAPWSFLTNHARVLICLAQDPGIRLREIGEAVGITERAAHRIVGELAADGYVTRRRVGRRNHYTVRGELPLPDVRDRRVGDLLGVLTAPPDSLDSVQAGSSAIRHRSAQRPQQIA
jgi:DNA-binding Lrp family transcriptional regulator